ncbi:MAG: hypothetical protein SOX72_05830 [Oscillospiraceae bacterium]|jgi:hypothetical protein|nr:hypothetical protein [Oscillospiraceae bacterium]
MRDSAFSKNLPHNGYFNSLPQWVKETISQTDVPIHSEEELRACAQNLMSGGEAPDIPQPNTRRGM